MKNEFEFEAGLADHIKRVSDAARAQFERLSAQCESEIERLLLARLIFLFGAPKNWTYGGAGDAPNMHVKLEPQRKVGRYRLDFAVTRPAFRNLLPALNIAVECDGHDFHERTKEQAARDRARDRFLVASGWEVLRFTGSEIFRDPQSCADEVQALIHKHNRSAINAATGRVPD